MICNTVSAPVCLSLVFLVFPSSAVSIFRQPITELFTLKCSLVRISCHCCFSRDRPNICSYPSIIAVIPDPLAMPRAIFLRHLEPEMSTSFLLPPRGISHLTSYPLVSFSLPLWDSQSGTNERRTAPILPHIPRPTARKSVAKLNRKNRTDRPISCCVALDKCTALIKLRRGLIR